MHRRPLFLVLLLFLPTFECIVIAEFVLRELELNGLQLQFNASCCPLELDVNTQPEPCIAEECPITSTEPRNIADGNAITGWMIDFVSDGLNGSPPTATFSLDFGQVCRTLVNMVAEIGESTPLIFFFFIGSHASFSEASFYINIFA